MLAALQAESGQVFVLDHLAGMAQGLPADDPAWSQLARLADGGAWITLSGWYRLDSAAPYSGLHAAIARATGLFGERVVWGSDWPHTGQPATPPLRYEDGWAPVAAALGASRAQRVREQGPLALYG